MRVGQKLNMNAGIILVLMIAIGATAVLGIRFIQGKIFEVTQKSTPYQIRVFNLQRALQSHSSNLLKVAASDSMEEFKNNSAIANASLTEEIQASDDVSKLSGRDSSSNSEISDVTKSVLQITEKRLALEQSTTTSMTALRSRLVQSSQRLTSLDDNIRKLQQASTGTMVSSIDRTTAANQQATNIIIIRDGFKDLMIGLSQLPTLDERRGVALIRSSAESTAANVIQAIKSTKWTGKTGEELEKKFRQTSSKIIETANLRLQYINDEDVSIKDKSDKLGKEAEYELSYILPMVIKGFDTANESLKTSSREMTKSITSFSESNTILITASNLISLSGFIESNINYSLTVRNSADLDKTVAGIQNAFAQVDKTLNKLRELLSKGSLDDAMKMYKTSADALVAVKQGFLGKDGVVEKMRASLANIEEVSKLNQKMKEIVSKKIQETNKEVVTAKTSQENAVSAVKSTVATTSGVIIIIAAVALVVSLILNRLITRSIMNPVHDLERLAAGFVEGDLTIRIDESTKDEFGKLAGHFNRAIANLSQVTSKLQDLIIRLSTNSQKLAVTAETLHKGAVEQASQTEQSATAVTEISQTIMDVAKNASVAADSSKGASDMAAKGKNVVGKTVRGMHEIAESVKGASSTIGMLKESSNKIGEIVVVIKDISDQTNLLALNAAIEAARAGEQGRGFAVVADEVRKLAERTGTATQEIAGIISLIQNDTEKSFTAMENAQVRVEEELKLTGEASDSLEAIVSASAKGVDMAQMIATATEEQSSAAEDVSQRVETIAEITKRLQLSTADIKQSSDGLATLADELSRMVAWFKCEAVSRDDSSQ